MNKDYYNILGVSESASQDEVKKAYRKLAKQYHPDSHPNDKQAENRFKEISEAYHVLSDTERRKKYDEYRKFGGRVPHGNFGGTKFGDFGDFRFEWGSQGENLGFGDLFSQFFGGGKSSRRSQTRTVKGQDIHANLTVPFEVAALGGKQPFSINYGGNNKSFSVNIKPGIEDGEKIRLRGQGAPGYGGQAGDLILTVQINKHPQFKKEGLNILSKVKLNLAQALLGTKIQVHTVEGKKIQLKIQPGSQNGSRLRLKGMGIKMNDGRAGDHFVELEVILPDRLSSSQKKMIKEFAKESNMDY
jgi:DnaJ-class molecular chaperone